MTPKDLDDGKAHEYRQPKKHHARGIVATDLTNDTNIQWRARITDRSLDGKMSLVCRAIAIVRVVSLLRGQERDGRALSES